VHYPDKEYEGGMIKMEKNMSAVENYQMEDKLKFLRGMAFNNAAVLLSGRKYEKELLDAEMVFDLAEQLFDEAIKRNWLEYGKTQKTPVIPVSKEIPAIPVVMTEKEGKAMGNDDIVVV
jgi:hypothetical protein